MKYLKELAVDKPEDVDEQMLGFGRRREVLEHTRSTRENGPLTRVGQQQLRVHLVQLVRTWLERCKTGVQKSVHGRYAPKGKEKGMTGEITWRANQLNRGWVTNLVW